MSTGRPPSDGADGQQTLRILIFVPISLLMLTIVVFAAMTGAFNDSISAHYGGPVRDVFVGCLVAAALGVVCFRGTSDLEDLTLNSAGFYAPFVAFVPFDFASSSPTVRAQGAVDPATSLRVILVCYLVAALAFVLFDYFKGAWPVRRLWGARDDRDAHAGGHRVGGAGRAPGARDRSTVRAEHAVRRVALDGGRAPDCQLGDHGGQPPGG